MIKSFSYQTLIELRLFLRDPGAAFFALAFPLILLVANNSVGGEDPEGGSLVAVPMLTAMVLGMIGVTLIPATIGEYRQNGILRRLMATPNTPFSLLFANTLAQLAVALLAMVLLVLAGITVYGAAVPSAPLVFLAVWLLGALSLAAVGFLVAALAPTGRSATAFGFVLFFPMLYVSGAMVPRESLPDTVATIGAYTPMGPVTESLRDVWDGSAPQPLMLVAMAGITVVASGVAAKCFRW